MKRLLRGALVVVAVSTAALHAQQSGAPYRLVPNWGVLPGGATWGEVPGMAIDAKGKVFAFHRAEPPIVELDGSGKVLKMWGDKMFAWPHGIRVDRFGALWITDGRGRDGIGEQVFKFSPAAGCWSAIDPTTASRSSIRTAPSSISGRSSARRAGCSSRPTTRSTSSITTSRKACSSAARRSMVRSAAHRPTRAGAAQTRVEC